MNFISIEFILFFPLVLLLFYIVPTKFRWITLLTSSYFFYFYWNPWTVFLLLVTTFVSYISAIKIEKSESKSEKKFWLALTLVVCLGFLGVFKYLSFFLNSLVDLVNLFGLEKEKYILNIFLPIGISFYTFQTLSYVIDVYRNDIQAEKHFGYYALFISYFPQLVAGPIERPSNLLPQLKSRKNVTSNDFIIGLQIALRGFFKKLIIADYLGNYVDTVYRIPSEANGIALIIGTVMFAFQIYCDFSGYSDIAVGIARMMGIKLMENFDRPYSAISIQDFWRRWHISLTSWFTDYVYIPLGGNRRGISRQFINIMIVFLISGVWHGAAWNYILWGCIHGFYMVVSLLIKNVANGKARVESPITLKCKQFTTFVLVTFAWVFFRADNIKDAFILLSNLFSGWTLEGIESSLTIMGLNARTLIYILFSLLCLSKFEKADFICKDDTTEFEKNQMVIIIFLLFNLLALGWLSLLSLTGESTFIYFQF